MKIRKADTIFSQYMRKTIKKCEMCGRSDIKLELAHYHGRRKESVRFDTDNCSVFCFSCHRKTHTGEISYEKWLKEKLGEKRFDLLTLRANMTQKKDDEAVIIYYKNKLKELEGE